ncbi:MAG: 16S rRNA (adenine(1518)-N(6)/adenine(1519)-N(6))-dimethyltransferase RsmA [Putridiphycobacter sp.]
MSVRAKKHLGQHFLTDLSICQRINEAILVDNKYKKVLEVGPGMGALTQFLLANKAFETHVIEIDRESVDYLSNHFPSLDGKIYATDFLKNDLKAIMGEEPFAVVGNFPYNISTQILFKVLDYKDQIPEIVGMFQKEVAVRIAEKPGTKKYGITSVLLQAYYDIEYLFTVDEHVFNPPPKVKSGVIRLIRNNVAKLDCDESLFKQVVKQAFNQRRKTIRNSIKSLIPEGMDTSDEIFSLRPEKLAVADFIRLSNMLTNKS